MGYPIINLQATGNNIKKLRKRSEFSVAELQNYFGFEYPNAIYKWQKGECLPTVDNLLALSMLFQVSMNDILVYEDQDFLFSTTGLIYSTTGLMKLY
jgi:transcriptional regulator with XRE-family HTH domain